MILNQNIHIELKDDVEKVIESVLTFHFFDFDH
jgi:hypothetical protein